MGKAIVVCVTSLALCACATLGKIKEATETGCDVVLASGVCDVAGDAIDSISLLAKIGKEVVGWVKSLAADEKEGEVSCVPEQQ